jgi:prepilin-type N-terminal cleavage/methylation domain-containing protein
MTSKRSGGFSFIELIVTIVMMGVLSAVAVTSISAKAQHSVTVQADQFRSDLSHLQLLAISQGVRLKLTVASTATGYSVYCAVDVTLPCPPSTATPITDPATGAPFSVTLTDGVRFLTGTGTSGPGNYYFDSLGRPVSTATTAALVTGTTTFSLNGVGRATAVDVTVLPITGFAQTNYH